MRTIKERLEAKTFYSPDGCHYFIGATNNQGYGNIAYKGRSERASRISYLINKGNPGKFHVLHTCDNPCCINPDHLFLGTDLDNSIDKIKKGRAKALKGTSHPLSILTDEQVLEIRTLYGTDTARAIGKRYGVSKSCIEGIFYKTNWRHL